METYAQNAPDYLKIPIFDYYEDGAYRAVHPDVLFHKNKYWMVFTPGLFSPQENPTIVVSNDGQNWDSPLKDGTTLTLDSPDDGGHNSDPDMIIGNDGLFYVFWRWSSSDHRRAKVYVSFSEDGLDWSPKKRVLSSDEEAFISPAVIVDRDGSYKMYYVDRGAWRHWLGGISPELKDKLFNLRFRTAEHPEGPWSEPTICEVDLKPGQHIWHLDVIRAWGKYYAFVVFQRKLHLITSQDGNTWEIQSKPVLVAGKEDAWDNDFIYRASALPRKENGFDLWYSAFCRDKKRKHNSPMPASHIGYTKFNL